MNEEITTGQGDGQTSAKKQDIRLVLLAARACCLNCQYCFVKRTNELMPIEMLKNSIDFLFTSERKNLQLQYFGGEPLMLPMDVFAESVDYAMARAEESGRNLKIIITTNAIFLNEERISFLQKYKDQIIIEVSLDGRKESHNINRPQKNDIQLDSYTMITKNFPLLNKSGLYARVSMVVSPHTTKELLDNFEHLLDLGFNKIWLMLACGVLWEQSDIDEFEKQLRKIADKYYDKIKTGEILFMNLRDWFAPYRMNSELIVDIDGKIYPACMNYLVEDEEVKQQYCLGQLGQEGLLGIDHYEELRISNDEAIGVFFQVNNIIPNYDSNIKTGMMINRVVKDINDRLAADGVNVMDYFNEYSDNR